MKEFLQLIVNNWEIVTGLFATVGVIILRVTACWPYVKKAGAYVKTYLTAPMSIRKLQADRMADAELVKKQLETMTLQFSEAFAALSKSIAAMKYELTTNGGGSTKDAVTRVEDAMFKLTAMVGVLTDQAKAAYMEIDPTTCSVTVANRAACNLLGLHSDQVRNNGWLQALHPDDRTDIVRRVRECIEEKLPFAARLRLDNSSVRAVDMSASLLFSPRTGKALCFVVSLQPADVGDSETAA